jgi:hypothetical protein
MAFRLSQAGTSLAMAAGAGVGAGAIVTTAPVGVVCMPAIHVAYVGAASGAAGAGTAATGAAPAGVTHMANVWVCACLPFLLFVCLFLLVCAHCCHPCCHHPCPPCNHPCPPHCHCPHGPSHGIYIKYIVSINTVVVLLTFKTKVIHLNMKH